MNTSVHSSVLAPVRAVRRPLREEDGVAHERGLGQSERHITVLPQEVLSFLSPKEEDLVLDATVGEGGHSERILLTAPVRLIGLDADPEVAARARARLAPFGDRVRLVEANFAELETVLGSFSVTHINKALFDLGWNRNQLSSGRGFSFIRNEPLSMSYGPTPASGFTASQMLNTWSEQALADAIFGYGEERYARRIAKKIIEVRAVHPFTTTGELLQVIEKAVPVAYIRGRTHFATRTFQAIRIAVNSELSVLEQGLRSAWKYLSPGGRLVVISFHSTEDRVVKNLMREFGAHEGLILSKKPVIAGADELQANPSARSAKLRAIEKI